MAPRRVNREEKSMQILQAAAQVFARRGLRASTMSQIAASAAVGKGTLYEYFPSKQALFLAVFDTFVQDMLREAEAMLREPETGELSAAEKLESLVRLILAWTGELRELAPLWMEIWAAASTEAMRQELGESLRQLYVEFRRQVADIIAEGKARGEFRENIEAGELAAVCVGALDGLFLQSWFDPAFDPRSAGEHFMQTLLRGMRPELGED